jgi:hypothetical protein
MKLINQRKEETKKKENEFNKQTKKEQTNETIHIKNNKRRK